MINLAFSPQHIASLERPYLDSNNIIDLKALAPIQMSPSEWSKLDSIAKRDPDDTTSDGVNATNLLAGCAVVAPYDHLLFALCGTGPQVEVAFAITDPMGRSIDPELLRALLLANIPGAKISAVNPELGASFSKEHLGALTYTAAMVGTPIKVGKSSSGRSTPLDLFITGLRQTSDQERWAYSVVSRRLPSTDISARIQSVLSELRAVADSARGSQPGAEYYATLLKRTLNKLKDGRAVGLWSVSTQLLANSEALLSRAKAAALSAFCGRQSVPDAVRCISIVTGAPAAPLRYDETAPSAHSFGPELILAY